jgi:hypothetical protein
LTFNQEVLCEQQSNSPFPEHDLIPLSTKSQLTPTTLQPIIPEVAMHQTLTLQQSRQVLENAQAVRSFGTTEDPSPKDPFVENDPSSGQQQNNNELPMPILPNQRLFAKQQPVHQVGPFLNGLQPIVPEVVVRGALIQDPRIPMSSKNIRLPFSTCHI